MGDFSLLGAQRYDSLAHDTTNSRGTAVVTGAANTKSAAWVQLIASTPTKADGLLVYLDLAAAGQDALVDLAIGAAGSEVIIAANLFVGSGTGASGYGTPYILPIMIPEGTRLAVKAQSTTSSATIRVQVHSYIQGFHPSAPLHVISTYGITLADSSGTVIDPGATINTKGAWVQLVSATDRQHFALLLAIGGLNTTRSAATWLIDIGIGLSTAEQVLIGNIALASSTSADTMLPQVIGPLPVDIPAGTRLSVRAQCSINTAAPRLFDAMLYGVG